MANFTFLCLRENDKDSDKSDKNKDKKKRKRNGEMEKKREDLAPMNEPTYCFCHQVCVSQDHKLFFVIPKGIYMFYIIFSHSDIIS